jgi:hypothetical protein
MGRFCTASGGASVMVVVGVGVVVVVVVAVVIGGGRRGKGGRGGRGGRGRGGGVILAIVAVVLAVVAVVAEILVAWVIPLGSCGNRFGLFCENFPGALSVIEITFLMSVNCFLMYFKNTYFFP